MGRILAMDLGDKTIGIAVSDENKFIAQGVETIHRKDKKKDLLYLTELVSKYGPEKIIIGLPVNMNGTIGEQAKKVLQFVKEIKSAITCPIETWDERLSTASAYRILEESGISFRKKKKVIDKIAASFILQNYLDFIKGKEVYENRTNN